MPIDWNAIDVPSVALLSAFAFLSSLVGHLLSFRSRFLGAILAAVLFAGICVLWFYYPPGHVLTLGTKSI